MMTHPSLTLPMLPYGEALTEIYRRLLAHPNVVGCFIGQKRRAGYTFDELAIVACVNRKIPSSILPESATIPKQISWKPTSRTRVPVQFDVQPLQATRREATVVAGPGDTLVSLMTPKDVIPAACTVGVVIKHKDFGAVVTTAGHGVWSGQGRLVLKPNQRPRVGLLSHTQKGSVQVPGVLLSATIEPQSDHALIAIHPDVLTANLYRDVYPIERTYEPGANDVGKARVRILGAKHSPLATFRGLKGLVPFSGVPMKNVILTDPVTALGDSGAVAVDAKARAWGLLIGSASIDGVGYSAFTPVSQLLGSEANATLY